jgi:O-antigen/teichoic acid export membrane protein
MCFGFILYPFHTINLQTLSAIGRSDIFLKLEIIKKIIGFALLVLSCRMGVLWMVAISTLVGGPLGVIVNAYPNQKLLGYSVVMQIRDTMPSLFASVFMGICVYSLTWINETYLRLFLQLILGASIYIFLSWFFRIEAFREYITAIDITIGGHVPRFAGQIYQRIVKRMGI